MKRMGATLAVVMGVLSWGCSDDQGVRAGGAREVPSTTTTVAPTTSKATTTTATAASPGQPDGVTFTDPGGAYTIVIGTDWKEVSVMRGIQSWTIGPPAGGFQPNVNVIVQSGIPVDLQTYMDDAFTGSAAVITEAHVIGQKIVTGAQGQELGRLEYTGIVSGQTLHFLSVVSIEHRTAILATFTGNDALFAQLVPEIEPHLLTLQQP